jgi:hypothetical protein
MNTQEVIEQIATAIYNGMTAEEARKINSGDGFTIDHDGNDGGGFSRTENVTVSDANLEAAIKMAESGEFPY